MQALVQSLGNLIAALTCAAFAQFGVALKGPCPAAHQSADVIAISSVPAPPKADPTLRQRGRRQV
jgi:hypothetical protein